MSTEKKREIRGNAFSPESLRVEKYDIIYQEVSYTALASRQGHLKVSEIATNYIPDPGLEPGHP